MCTTIHSRPNKVAPIHLHTPGSSLSYSHWHGSQQLNHPVVFHTGCTLQPDCWDRHSCHPHIKASDGTPFLLSSQHTQQAKTLFVGLCLCRTNRSSSQHAKQASILCQPATRCGHQAGSCAANCITGRRLLTAAASRASDRFCMVDGCFCPCTAQTQ